MKVVVVDDSEICLETVREMLQAAGHEVVTVSSPLGLSRRVAQEKPDVVLVDVQMPALRGDQAVAIVLQHHLHACKLVLHSDRPPHELERLARISGAHGYIRKTGVAADFLRELTRFDKPR